MSTPAGEYCVDECYIFVSTFSGEYCLDEYGSPKASFSSNMPV